MIYVSGQSHRFMKNLVEALLLIRNDTYDQAIWIDAISISQTDPAEKANHIGLIGKIFQQATHVLAWLGPADYQAIDISRLCVPVTRAVDPGEKLEKHVFRRVTVAVKAPRDQAKLLLSKGSSKAYTNSRMTAELRTRADILLKMMQRPYFRRMWIVQELIFARDITLRCGSALLPWAAFIECINQIEDYDPDDVRNAESPTKSFQDSIGTLRQNEDLKRLRLIQSHRQSFQAREMRNRLIPLIMSFRDTEQSLPHDRVYALLELETREHLEKPLKPSYALNLGQIYTQVLHDRTCEYVADIGSFHFPFPQTP
jgi:hypothetical protein